MNILGSLLALIASIMLPVSAYAEAVPSPFFIELANIEKVSCIRAKGSGVRIDADLVLTAAHVVSPGGCSVDGQPANIVHFDGARDLAVLQTAEPAGSRSMLACKPFARGGAYFAIGYASGEHLIVQRLSGEGRYRRSGEFRGLALLKGLIFPGMSGGAVIDGNGLVVGLVTAGNPYGLAMSRELTGTYLCKP